MPNTLFYDHKSAIPGRHDIALATHSSQELAPLIPKKQKDFQMVIKQGKKEVEITVPFDAIKLFLQILTEMSEGNAVVLMPIHAELSTQEAADLLSVSRPYLIKLLESGQIPFHSVGTHRRILFQDVLQYKLTSDKQREKALTELVEEAQRLNMGY